MYLMRLMPLQVRLILLLLVGLVPLRLGVLLRVCVMLALLLVLVQLVLLRLWVLLRLLLYLLLWLLGEQL